MASRRFNILPSPCSRHKYPRKTKLRPAIALKWMELEGGRGGLEGGCEGGRVGSAKVGELVVQRWERW